MGRLFGLRTCSDRSVELGLGIVFSPHAKQHWPLWESGNGAVRVLDHIDEVEMIFFGKEMALR